jgi:hypothetical protein
MERSFNLMSTLRRIAANVAEVLDLMFNAGPRLAELRQLATTSDNRLNARGLTRQGELARILGRR